LRAIDKQSVTSWLDDFCRTNPDSLVQDAVRALEFNLIDHDRKREDRAR